MVTQFADAYTRHQAFTSQQIEAKTKWSPISWRQF